MNKKVIECNVGENGYKMKIKNITTGATIFSAVYDLTSEQSIEQYHADVAEHIVGGGIKRPS